MQLIKYKVRGYNQFVWVDNKEIKKVSCECPDFTYRQIQIEMGMCKHLKKIVGVMQFKVKEKQEDIELSDAEKYEMKMNGKCSFCGTKQDLELHRIKRGSAGGKYTKNNLMVLCKKDHSNLHYGELGRRRVG